MRTKPSTRQVNLPLDAELDAWFAAAKATRTTPTSDRVIAVTAVKWAASQLTPERLASLIPEETTLAAKLAAAKAEVEKLKKQIAEGTAKPA